VQTQQLNHATLRREMCGKMRRKENKKREKREERRERRAESITIRIK